MATTAEISRITAHGQEFVHLSGDGQLHATGANLLGHYNVPSAIDRLFRVPCGHIEEWAPPSALSLYPDSLGRRYFRTSDVSYLWNEGKWFARDWDNCEEGTPPFVELTPALVLKDANEYGQFEVDLAIKRMAGTEF